MRQKVASNEPSRLDKPALLIQTTNFNAEQALTRDTVPTNIDAILFWQVYDAERAALEISNYRQAILSVAQTSTQLFSNPARVCAVANRAGLHGRAAFAGYSLRLDSCI